MEDFLSERKGQIDKISSMMQNINMIAKDINIHTQEQGEKLLNIDKDMGKTAQNTSGALKELQIAEVR